MIKGNEEVDGANIINYVNGRFQEVAHAIKKEFHAQPLVELQRLEHILTQYRYMAPPKFDELLLSAWRHEIEAYHVAIRGAQTRAHREADFNMGVSAPQYDAVPDYQSRIDGLKEKIAKLEQASRNGHPH